MDTVLALAIRADSVCVEPYTGDASQQFRIVQQNDGSVGIRALQHDAALTMSEEEVWASPYGGNAWQSFELKEHEDGTCTLLSTYYPVVLEMTDAGAVPRAHAQKDRVQRFYLQSTPDGGVAICKASVVFDTCSNANHLRGALSANVKFAQSQIISAVPTAGDHQPHLVAGRKALLMVKPLGTRVGQGDSLEVSVHDKDNELLGSLALSSPYDLPETVYSVASGAGDLDFSPPSYPPYTINSSSELEQLDDPLAAYLTQMLETHNWVLVQTADGSWVRDIHLPMENVAAGRRVTLSSAAGYSSTVFYSGRSVSVSKGEECQFIFAAGQWISDHEWANRMLVYAENTWSAEIPGAWLKPGISMRLRAGSLLGTLDNLKVGGRTELLIHTIDIGMLTTPRGEYAFANTPDAHTEYFQSIPVARMIVSNYQSLHLPQVMLPDGQLLTEFDPSEGGWHTGTMRQRIGKELISLGINNANYGLHCSPGEGELSPYVAAQLTAHNSRGNYVNGIQVHGGSGGGGIVTLDDSLGNEFSHEVGHNYGLGHYPGGFSGSVHRPAQALNSTWGWDMDLGRFIPNFRPTITREPTCVEDECQPPFHGRAFGLDPMAGGAPMSHLNRFTLHTPYTASLSQQFFERKAVFAADCATGFRRWDALTEGMEPYAHRIDASPRITASNSDLSEAALAALFDLDALVRIEMQDGNWAPRIEIPRASSANINRVITFNLDAGYNSELSINGQTLTVGRGFSKSYCSNGATWTETVVLDAGMARTTAPNNDLSQTHLGSLLARYAVLNVVMRDGDWGPEIHVPPASEFDERRVVTIDQGATYPTQLHINGLIISLNTGVRRTYVSEDGTWREFTHVEDVSVERVPKIFGVPVTTLVGYYDPQGELPHYIYPALHGAYGFVYEDDSGASDDPGWQLWVVTVAGVRRYNLPGIRLQANVMNKFHVNLDTSDRPEKVQLLYRGETLFTRTLETPQEELVYTINGE